MVSPLAREIDVDLGTGTARPGITHHPEIVFPVTVNDVDLRVQTGFLKAVAQ